jgi:mono/diheme cytochrome c family protein
MRSLLVATASFAALLPWGAALAQPQPDLGSDEQRAAGKEVYDHYCAQCHGDEGDGQGLAAAFLRPAPRDFTSGKFKIRSTPTGYLPTDADLERSIREGLHGTGMPAFPVLNDPELRDVIYYVKSFAPDFEDPSAYAEPIAIPRPPDVSEDSLETGFTTYVEVGCARCHGDSGRGDGRSAPTLRDDWGDFIAPADLTMPWTFRGGGTREDVFRSISTGLYGTPMAGFADGLSEEQRWQIVDWIVAQARAARGATGDDADPGRAPYGTLVRAVRQPEGLGAAAEGGDLQAARELFADAPKTLFPIAGQVMQPGRAFRPGTEALGVQAIYDDRDVAFLLTWHNLSAETGGSNAPDLQVPRQEQGVGFVEAGSAAAGAEAEAEDAGAGEPAGGGAADFFGQATETAAPGRPPGSDEFSDAVAIQLPSERRAGVEKPYFLFGDPGYPVDLWFIDLADPVGKLFEGRGSTALVLSDARPPEVLAGYEAGEWAVVFKHPRKPSHGIAFDEDTFVPVAFSVWDGFFRERGVKRGLTRWFHVYVEPAEEPSVVAPMAKAGLTVLGLELLVIALVRRRYKKP